MAKIIYFLLFLIPALVAAEELSDTTITDVDDTPVTFGVIQKPSQWTAYNILAVTTATFMVTVGVVTIFSIVFPLLTFKICYFFGGCHDQFPYFFDQLFPSEANPRNDLRTFDQISPIIKTLSDAYMKYNEMPDRKKRSLEEIDSVTNYVQNRRTKRSPSHDDKYLIVEELCTMFDRYFKKNTDKRSKRSADYVVPLIRTLSTTATQFGGIDKMKRSLESMAPILETMVQVYEKFGNEEIKKNFETASSSKKLRR